MSNYFEIRNNNGLLLVSEQSQTMQITSIVNFNVTSFNSNPIDNKYGYKPISPFVGYSPYLDADVRGHKTTVGMGLNAFRLFGDVENLPYILAQREITTEGNLRVRINSMGTQKAIGQTAYVSYGPLSKSLDNTGLVIYGEDEQSILFDASLGYVHHIASYQAKVNVISGGDFSVLLRDLTGLGLDYSKLFVHISDNPRVNLLDLNSNFYRIGYRCFGSRIRVTANKLYLDVTRWVPYSYGKYIDEFYFPMLRVMVFYVPNIKD